MKKLRVGVIYGGRSGEHEVSIASAAAVVQNLDKQRYEADPDPHRERRPLAHRRSAARLVLGRRGHRAEPRARRPAARPRRPRGAPARASRRRTDHDDRARQSTPAITGLGLDVVFPVLHGPYGEDGTVQGLLELANIPYVGAGVLASAVGMDKAVAKLVFAARGLPQVKYLVVLRQRVEGRSRRASRRRRVHARVSGIREAGQSRIERRHLESEDRRPSCAAAIDLAAEFDRKIVIEAAVPNAREIEIAVLGNDDPRGLGAGRDRSRRASSTTSRRSISTTTRARSFRPTCPRGDGARSSGSRSKCSAPWTAPAWRASTS